MQSRKLLGESIQLISMEIQESQSLQSADDVSIELRKLVIA